MFTDLDQLQSWINSGRGSTGSPAQGKEVMVDRKSQALAGVPDAARGDVASDHETGDLSVHPILKEKGAGVRSAEFRQRGKATLQDE